MDFTFSAEQDALRDAVRRTCSELGCRAPRFGPSPAIRGASPTIIGTSRTRLGWTGILVPVEQGGLGLGLVDAVVVLEEMGRVPAPGPFLSSAVLATLAARRLGALELLDSLAEGTQRGTIALEELGHGDPVERVRTRARRSGADWLLTGLKPLVLDGHTADWVIVAARTQSGLGSFLIEAPVAEVVPTMDPTRKAARLELRDTPATLIGPSGDQTDRWRRIADDAIVALAAELVGVSAGALEQAIEYAKVRVQFDLPIASHQVIQHKFVDMLHRLELGRVGVHHAAWASDADAEHRARAAAVAKASMGEAAVFVTAEAVQVHGAVGFTWDNDAHLYYKRAKQNDAMLGYQGYQRQRIADLVLDAT